MKIYNLLLLIPFVGLSSCATQKEITLDEANAIASQISQKAENIDSYTFNATNKGAMGKGKDKIEIDLSYTIEKCKNGLYSYFKGHEGNKSYDIEFYQVKNAKYEEVKLVRYFHESQNEYVRKVSLKKDNPDYDKAFYELAAYRPQEVCSFYISPYVLSQPLDEGDTIKCYSSKDGELTINLKSANKNPETDTETTVKGDFTYHYKDYRFESMESNSVSNYDNNWSTRAKMEYKDNINVELPSDWEKLISQEA